MNELLSVSLQSKSREETFCLGVAFGQAARGGEVIGLIGDLGTGKTQFVQGLAVGLDVGDATVNSPTYTLIQCYKGRLPLIHVDLYRVEHLAELDDFGLEDAIDGQGVSAIEWADKGETFLPFGRLNIYLRDLEEDQREIELQATDPRHQSWLAQVCQNKKVLPLIQSGKNSE